MLFYQMLVLFHFSEDWNIYFNIDCFIYFQPVETKPKSTKHEDPDSDQEAINKILFDLEHGNEEDEEDDSYDFDEDEMDEDDEMDRENMYACDVENDESSRSDGHVNHQEVIDDVSEESEIDLEEEIEFLKVEISIIGDQHSKSIKIANLTQDNFIGYEKPRISVEKSQITEMKKNAPGTN